MAFVDTVLKVKELQAFYQENEDQKAGYGFLSTAGKRLQEERTARRNVGIFLPFLEMAVRTAVHKPIPILFRIFNYLSARLTTFHPAEITLFQ